MGASVLFRLKKQAKEKGMNYQTCLQLFAQEEFLRKLEVSRYVENLILKGGMFLYTISHYEGRPTMDIDFMLRRMPDDVTGMKAVMEEICQADTHNDFMEMKVLGTREITPDKQYPGIGINLMAYIKNVRIPFSVDIGVDDIIIPGAVKRRVTARLEGFKEPDIYTYSLESTMAEKKDSMEQIRSFVQNEYLQNLWKNYNPGSGLEKPDFSTVLEQIERFIGPVYEKILQEKEFFGMWSSRENVWK